MNTITLARIQKDFPEEWARISSATKKGALPELPSKLRKELRKTADRLMMGDIYDIPSTKLPLIYRCTLQWEEDVYPDITSIDKLLPTPAASAAEKRLINIITQMNIGDYDEICDMAHPEIRRSATFKKFAAEIKAFCKLGTSLEKKYDFSFDTLLHGVF